MSHSGWTFLHLIFERQHGPILFAPLYLASGRGQKAVPGRNGCKFSGWQPSTGYQQAKTPKDNSKQLGELVKDF